KYCLFKLNLCADLFELRLDLGSIVLVDAFLHILRGAFDQILGLFEPESGNGPNLFDHFDLFLPGIGENDREFGLFLGLPRPPPGATPPPRPAATATAAAAETPHFSSRSLASSAASSTVRPERSFTIFCRSAMIQFLRF